MIKDIIKKLCEADGVSGNEENVVNIAMQILKKYARVKSDNRNNVVAVLGNEKAELHLMLDAHIDQVGFMVTDVDKDLIKFTTVGGMDRRILVGTEVKILGKKIIAGVIKSNSDDKDKVPEIKDLFIDTALSEKDLKDTVAIGDTIILNSKVDFLINDKVASSALDNRCGVATLIYCAYLLKDCNLNCKVSIVLSSQEETTSLGAKTKAFEIFPDEAIVVDVSFAKQIEMDNIVCGEFGKGSMIGISPILDKENTNIIKNIARENNIPIQYEVMGGNTGTNSDDISLTKSGIPTILLSVPLRYMHTGTEVVNMKDIENTAILIKNYVLSKGGRKHEV